MTDNETTEKEERIAETRFALKAALMRYRRAVDAVDPARREAHLKAVIDATLDYLEATV